VLATITVFSQNATILYFYILPAVYELDFFTAVRSHVCDVWQKKAQISNLIETKIDSGYKVKNRTQSFNMYTVHKVK